MLKACCVLNEQRFYWWENACDGTREEYITRIYGNEILRSPIGTDKSSERIKKIAMNTGRPIKKV